MNRQMPDVPADRRLAERLLGVIAALLLILSIVPAGSPADPPPPAEIVHRVDLNRAAWYDLVNLPGIGAGKAREIVRAREIHGPIRSERDLLKVRGIGPVTVAAIREHLEGELR